MNAQDQDGELGIMLADLLEHFQAASPGHGNIRYHYIPGFSQDLFEQIFGVRYLGYRGAWEFFQQNLFESPSDYRVIIRDQYFSHVN
jgi:hypothetical protein